MAAASLPTSGVTVSVCMITYNHEAYIAQAIEGVLMQQTDFRVELVIGEDCSTDRTREIVCDYATRYPGRIRPLLNERNMGTQRNFVATLETCSGKYIALCEGDDYWTDPLKLQKQVDFLDFNPGCAISYHPVITFYEDGQRMSHVYPAEYQKPISNLEDIIKENFIPTCSVVFRHGLFSDFPAWFYNLKIGDWPLHIFNAQYGKIGFIDDVMAAYRIHHGGIWSSTDVLPRLLAIADIYQHMQDYLNSKYTQKIKATLSDYYLNFANIYMDLSDIKSAKAYLTKSISENPFNLFFRFTDMAAMFGRLYTPAIYKLLKPLWKRFQPRAMRLKNGSIPAIKEMNTR